MRQSVSTGLLIAVGVLMELCFLAFYVVSPGPEEVLLFIAVNAATFLLLAFLLWRMRGGAKPPPRTWLPAIALFGLLFRLTLIPHGVVGSD
ncbi:MAG TPA: hypothetical protein VK569_09525, partial [Bacteroidota bacterium]|nr:hypothetical protein [Bacteroidota bacterium]